MKKLIFMMASLVAFNAQAQDNFFSGFANACKHPKAYQNFQQNLCKSVVDKEGNEHCALGSITLPENIKSLVASNTLKNNIDHTSFDINLKPGITFANNNIVAIEQWSGHSNGIWGTALVVEDKNIKSVNQKIKASGIKIKRIKDPDFGDIGMQVAKGDDGKVRLVCDTST